MGKGDTYRPVNLERYGKNYDSIFGTKKERTIDYSENYSDNESTNIDKQTIIVDENGKRLKFTNFRKNKLYNKAKELKEEIKGSICTKSECWNPTEHNINKMLKSEFKISDKVNAYKMIMKTIGADPKDIDTERLRKGR